MSGPKGDERHVCHDYCGMCGTWDDVQADWRAIAEELAGAADEASEWMHANPPANGWGLLDRGADADSKAIRDRIRAALARFDAAKAKS